MTENKKPVDAERRASSSSTDPEWAVTPQPRWARSLRLGIDVLGRSVSWLAVLMVLLTALVVVLRYGLGIGSVALQESIIYMHATLFMVGASYALSHDAHVRVDVFYRDWSITRKAWIDLLGTLFMLFPLSIFTLWASFSYVLASWSFWEASPEAGGLPAVFLLKSLILVMPVLLLLSGVVRLARSWSIIRTHEGVNT